MSPLTIIAVFPILICTISSLPAARRNNLPLPPLLQLIDLMSPDHERSPNSEEIRPLEHKLSSLKVAYFNNPEDQSASLAGAQDRSDVLPEVPLTQPEQISLPNTPSSVPLGSDSITSKPSLILRHLKVSYRQSILPDEEVEGLENDSDLLTDDQSDLAGDTDLEAGNSSNGSNEEDGDYINSNSKLDSAEVASNVEDQDDKKAKMGYRKPQINCKLVLGDEDMDYGYSSSLIWQMILTALLFTQLLLLVCIALEFEKLKRKFQQRNITTTVAAEKK